MIKLSRLRTALSCCAILMLAACGTLTTTDITPADIEAAHQTQGKNLRQIVDSHMQPLIESGHTPGAIVGVLMPDGNTQFFGYGVADQETRVPPTGDTVFAIGSLSKGFLGAVTALLVDQGVLSWNETLRTLLPPGTPLSPDAEKITLLQLATHTSGLPRQPVTLQTLGYFIEYLFDGENFYRHFDRDYIFNYLTDFEADNPGKPQYSNIGYGILGYILERRTGMSVEALEEHKIFKPLKLKCTGFAPEELPCMTRAHGYAGDQPKFIARGEPVPDWHFTPFMMGAAGLYSNAHDLLTFAAAHLRQKTHFNTVLTSDMKVRTPQATRAAAIAWIVDDVDDSPITYQIGIVAGYTSYIGLDAKHKTAVVVMQNSFNWDSSMGHKLLLDLRAMTAQSAKHL